MGSTAFQLDSLGFSSYERSGANESSSFHQVSALTDTLALPQNPIPSYNRNVVFYEFDASIYDAASVEVVTACLYANWITLGSATTLDITLSDEIRNCTVKVNYIEQPSSYMDKHIYVLYQPQATGEQTTIFDITLTDSGGNMISQIVTMDMFVDDGSPKLKADILRSEMCDQVFVGQTGVKEFSFNLQAPSTTNILDALTLNIQTLPSTTPLTNLSLIDASSNAVIAQLSSFPYNQDFLFPLQNGPIITSSPSKYYLTADLSGQAPVGLTFNIELVSFLSHKLNGIAGNITTTEDALSNLNTIIQQNQPIIRSAVVDNFISSNSSVSINLSFDLEQDSVGQIAFQLIDVTSANTSSSLTKPFIPAQSSSTTSFTMSNNIIDSLSMIHNHQYELSFQLHTSQLTITGNTNTFKVDLTPPTKPAAPRVEEVSAIQSAARISGQNLTPIKFTFDAPPSLDVESGIKCYKIWCKSAKNPNWSVITCNPAISSNTSIQIQQSQEMGDLYSYKIQVENNAVAWSDQSDVTYLDLRTSEALIDTFYNGPNPFDSRIEQTTLYYSLGSDADVDIRIIDIFGYLIRRWSFSAGMTGGSLSNTLIWDGTNTFGDKVSKGVYFAILKATDSQGNSMQKICKIGVIH